MKTQSSTQTGEGQDGNPRAGFSLVEVSLAVLVVGLGLVVVFGLFPSGLRSSEASNTDTRMGLFADTVLSGMAADAGKITSWKDWQDLPTFQSKVITGLAVTAGGVQKTEYPAGSGFYVRYLLTIEKIPGNEIARSATLQVADGQYGAFVPQATFFRGFFYSGF